MNVLDLCLKLADNQLPFGQIYVDLEADGYTYECEIVGAENRPGVYGLVLIPGAPLTLKPEPDEATLYTIAEILAELEKECESAVDPEVLKILENMK